jgi:hypothetical protein
MSVATDYEREPDTGASGKGHGRRGQLVRAQGACYEGPAARVRDDEALRHELLAL